MEEINNLITKKKVQWINMDKKKRIVQKNSIIATLVAVIIVTIIRVDMQMQLTDLLLGMFK